MQTIELPGWRIEHDRSATVALYQAGALGIPETCGCLPCLNWASTRERIVPAEFSELLTQLGISLNGEAEVYHNAKLDSGLHSYGAWYHFVGRVVFGEIEDSPMVPFGAFSVFFHSHPILVRPNFLDATLVQLEVDAEVPWLSEYSEVP